MKIISVVGARPNFMKIAPFIKAIKEFNRQPATSNQQLLTHLLVHTGQHYDDSMSKSFFKELNIPKPDINLEIGSGTHAQQVGQTMIAFEKVLKKHKPDWVVVVGDVNATLACSVTAKKEHIKCCHIEAGLRSDDLDMPEEINRLVTDRLSDLLLTPDRISIENLKKEGVSEKKIKFVGNIMIDTLEANRKKASKISIDEIISNNLIDGQSPILSFSPSQYALMTLHRPSNVDKKEILEPFINFLIKEVAHDMPLIWTMHPRTKKQLESFDLLPKILKNKNIFLLNPLEYHDMLKLNMQAKIMLTDSGGLQEECTILGTPCLTLRWNTERPITLTKNGGASVLVGNNVKLIRKEYKKMLAKNIKPKRPELWDGHTAERCLKAIMNYEL
jgi:UDP-N-acetylglucosamine 2-epimerase (non-hydrolysing)